jgi:predicted aldo/keto reductase-like oxidoreductase
MLRAAALGLPVIVMEPLLGGKLATGLPAAARRHFAQADPRVSPASWALRWLWDQPEPTVVLSGMNSAEQLADNLAAASSAAVGMLSEKERAVFAPVVEAVRAAYRVPCTGCNYCMPCPHNVNIPGVFSAYNARHALGMIAGTTQYLTSTNLFSPNGNLGPRNCTRCGRCEAKCPQKIAIPDELAAALRRMEPFWIKPVLSIARKLL